MSGHFVFAAAGLEIDGRIKHFGSSVLLSGKPLTQPEDIDVRADRALHDLMTAAEVLLTVGPHHVTCGGLSLQVANGAKYVNFVRQ